MKIGLMFILLILALGAPSVNSQEKTNIVIGVSPQEPYFLGDGTPGLTHELIHAMNQIQQQYHFTMMSIPVKRAFQMLSKKWVDLIIWDNPMWGWKNKQSVQVSLPLIHEKDVFVAQLNTSRTQVYFDELVGKKLVLVNGYHYQFLNLETNVYELIKEHTIKLVKTEYAALEEIVSGRADVTVVSESSLGWFLTSQPQYQQKLLISERYDSEYERYFLLPEHGKIPVQEINQIIKVLSSNGTFNKIYEKYGLRAPTYIFED